MTTSLKGAYEVGGLTYQTAKATLSDLSSSATATDVIPAGATVLGVKVITTTAITGAANFSVGDGTDADKWGATLTNIAASDESTSADFTAGDPTHYAAATSVVLTPNASFTAGAAVVEVYYFSS